MRLLLCISCLLSIVCCLPWKGSVPNTDYLVELQQEFEPSGHGVDVSFPTHYDILVDDNNNHYEARREFYGTFLEGCQKYFDYEKELCVTNERKRMEANLNQPAASHNYTQLGFAKTKLPRNLLQALQEHKFANYNDDDARFEYWPAADTWMNQWMYYIVTIDIPDTLVQRLVSAIQPALEQWVSQPLVPVMVSGIRMYSDGIVIAPHVDHAPLIISAAVAVHETETNDSWPLELIDHDGQAHHLKLGEGDVVFYEGHSVIHGRPFLSDASAYSEILLHFMPANYKQPETKSTNLKQLYKSVRERKSVPKKSFRLPDYIVKGMPEDGRYMQAYTYKKRKHISLEEHKRELGQTAAHTAAAQGDLDKLRELANSDPGLLDKADSNGWKPLHEAARGGRTEVIKFLIEHGVDVNERTNKGKGGSPRWWVEHFNDEDHEAVQLLRKLNAIVAAPNMDA